MSERHLYHIDEGGCVDHWIVATSEAEALEIGRRDYSIGDNDPEDEITVTRVPDDKPFRVSCVDDDPETEDGPPGAVIENLGMRPEKYPTITATAGEWARFCQVGAIVACSEF